jgi:hypothetical protein
MIPRACTGSPAAYRCDTSPRPMQRGTAHSGERSSNSTVVTERGSIAHRLACPAKRRAIDVCEALVCQPLRQRLCLALPNLSERIGRVVWVAMADDIETHRCRSPLFVAAPVQSCALAAFLTCGRLVHHLSSSAIIAPLRLATDTRSVPAILNDIFTGCHSGHKTADRYHSEFGRLRPSRSQRCKNPGYTRNA